MIEQRVLDYLNKEMEVACYMERPEDLPESYILIERTGGSKTNHLSTATFAIQSYAASLLGAATLNNTMKAAMEEMTELVDIFSVSLNSDYNYTNNAFKGYRYQAVFNIIYKE
jgi:hypothetical protein